MVISSCCNTVIANLIPSALAAGQENGRDARAPTHGCQHSREQRPPAADGEGTSAQGGREPQD